MFTEFLLDVGKKRGREREVVGEGKINCTDNNEGALKASCI